MASPAGWLLLALATLGLARAWVGIPIRPYLRAPSLPALRLSGEEAAELMEKAAALRREAQEMEDSLPTKAASPLVSAEDVVSDPEVLPGSCWKVAVTLDGTADVRDNKIPVALTFKCRLMEDGVVKVWGSPYVKRGYVWELDRDPDKETYLAFDIEVAGVNIVDDGKLYLNSRCKRRDDGGGISLSDGVTTVKQVQNERGFGLFSFSGILAEFKVCGTFTALPCLCEEVQE